MHYCVHSTSRQHPCVACQFGLCSGSILPCWADAGLDGGYGNAIEVGPRDPGLGRRRGLLCSDRGRARDSVWLQTAMVGQLLALPHYASLLQAWGPVRMYAFVNAPQLVIAGGENEDGGNEAKAPCSASGQCRAHCEGSWLVGSGSGSSSGSGVAVVCNCIGAAISAHLSTQVSSQARARVVRMRRWRNVSGCGCPWWGCWATIAARGWPSAWALGPRLRLADLGR